MNRFLTLLVLAGLIAACDAGVSDPPGEERTLTVTVAGEVGVRIGAVLLSVDGQVEAVEVGGRALITTEGDRTLVAVVPWSAGTGVAFTLKTPTGIPAVELLQVAGPDNELYPDPAAFTVDAREEE